MEATTEQSKLQSLCERARSGDSEARLELSTRFGAVRDVHATAMPGTMDPDARTVDAVLSTEAPVEMFDWERWEFIPEVLSAKGATIRGNRDQVPLQDSHSTRGVTNTLGSVTNIRVENDRIVGTLRFADTEQARAAFALTRDGHLTDVSVGYRVNDSLYIPGGERAAVGGKEYEGPMKIARSWELHELSLVAVGADTGAQIRSLVAPTPESNPGAFHVQERNIMDTNAAKPGDGPAEGAKAPIVDVALERKNGSDAEFNRIKEIREFGTLAGATEEVIQKLINGRESLDEAKRQIMADFTERRQVADPVRVTITRDEHDTFQRGASDALLVRGGVITDPTKASKEAARYSRMSILDLARECLILSGDPVRDVVRMGREEVFRRAFSKRDRSRIAFRGGERAYNHTTSDFPNLLADTVNRSLQAGYGEAPVAWNRIARTVSIPDFRNRNVVGLSAAPTLEKVLENGEVSEGALTEKNESYALSTYAKIISITRQSIINDDLDAFTRNPFKLGQGAARSVEMKFFAHLRDSDNLGPTMGEDSTNLFDASGHANYTASGTALSVASLQVGTAAMANQTGLAGEYLNLMAAILLVCPEIEATANQLIGSNVDPAKSNSTVNPYFNKFQVVASPYWAQAFTYDGTTTSADLNHWALIASNAQIDTAEVGFLDGVSSPSLVEEEGFDILGMRLRAVLDFGVKVIDWRGFYKNAGA